MSCNEERLRHPVPLTGVNADTTKTIYISRFLETKETSGMISIIIKISEYLSILLYLRNYNSATKTTT